MPDIRCPNCGKNNPDFLDVCQFCQTSLKSDSLLHIGEKPTRKDTGELERVLPDWLRDVRQQSRESAQEEETAQSVTPPKIQKNEPPDLLAGLASQSGNEDEDIPDWLASINPVAKPKPAAASAPAPETDFFAQFNKPESKPEPPPKEVPVDMGVAKQAPFTSEKDELSDWFASQASQAPEEVVEPPSQDMNWARSFDSSPAPAQEPAPKEEDLSWLHNLEEASKQTGDLQTPKQSTDWMADLPATPSQPVGAQEDLSWLDRLGGVDINESLPSAPTFEPQPVEPSRGQQPSEPFSTPQEDLSWLDQFAAKTQDSRPAEPPASRPAAEDLSWLNDLGATSEPAQSFETAQDQPSPSQEDLSWLSDLGGEPKPASAPPFADFGAATELPPRQTAPLGDLFHEEMPDWLKSAAEASSKPADSEVPPDWFQATAQPVEEKAPATPPAAPFETDIFSAPAEPSSLSSQDVDSLFSVDMPDWLSQPEPGAGGPASAQAEIPLGEAGGDESLVPVDLPSWVQAMRPVEAVISETVASPEDQPEEQEGPLAGLRGVIPVGQVGSAQRPKAVSLKLQASAEQQAGAALLERILGSETNPRPLTTAPVVGSQQVLRWILAALFLIVISVLISMRSEQMPVSPDLPQISGISNTAVTIPDGAKVLVVIDYEPSLAGEMEVVGGPLLDQIVFARHPELSFISTSPSGSALVERLMTHTKINQPAPEGLGYQAGVQYFNLGYLPGGVAGVLGFMENPATIIPASGVGAFSDYAALIVLSDHAESGRIWVEQLHAQKQIEPALANKPLLMVASAQAGPLLEPYVSSGQITGMLSGLSEAAEYEAVNNNRPGIARSYWDTFGFALLMSIVLIVIGSLWSLITGIRARRAEAEQG